MIFLDPAAFFNTDPDFRAQIEFNECVGLWLLKKSISAQSASNPEVENVHPVRENRL
jgi:hypothetical protein